MTDAVPLGTLVSHLDSLLRIGEIPDESGAVNGLQVENSGRIRRVVAAVDASLATIEKVAADAGRETLIVVHHGLLWDGNVPVTGRRYRRIRTLLEHDLALYAAHIPLDVHPELGNNTALAALLGMPVEGWFGTYKGILLGVHGRLTEARVALVARLNQALGSAARLIPGGPEEVRRVGIITGSGAGYTVAAARAGLDTLITGEGAHHTYFDAMEFGVNVLLAGHYATERLGVQRLAQHLETQFGLPWQFHEHPTGL